LAPFWRRDILKVVVAVLLLWSDGSLGSCFNSLELLLYEDRRWAIGVGYVMEEMWCGVRVYSLQKRRKGRQANTHNDRILRRREQGPVHIAGSGPGRVASMRRKRGGRSATHPQLRATIAEALQAC
jgi:hypothetical protein